MTTSIKPHNATSPAEQANAPSTTRRQRPSRRRSASRSEAAHRDEVVRVGVYVRISTAREEMISPTLQHTDIENFLQR